jgi:hypothetical protein
MFVAISEEAVTTHQHCALEDVQKQHVYAGLDVVIKIYTKAAKDQKKTMERLMLIHGVTEITDLMHYQIHRLKVQDQTRAMS